MLVNAYVSARGHAGRIAASAFNCFDRSLYSELSGGTPDEYAGRAHKRKGAAAKAAPNSYETSSD